ncbi:WSN domain-containing protein [Caenorhabditis elegans]|nr:WSN domain-containing protein [Caenorhabditis elegans]CTQ86677.1 WSN domain-containing protein [Caenorhabditis elegans]|eukprot:NP_001299976.1 Uncharacterized protein CELE_Y116A8C.33 [Caenorhabditis elegans]
MNETIAIDGILNSYRNSDISNFKSENILKLIDDLKATSMGSEQEVLKVESQLIKYNTFIDELKFDGNTLELHGKYKFFDTLRDLAIDVKDSTDNGHRFIVDMLEYIGEMLQWLEEGLNVPFNITERTMSPQFLLEKLGSIMLKVSSVRHVEYLEGMNKSIESTFKPLREMFKLMNDRNEIHMLETDEKGDILSSSILQMVKLSKKRNDSEEDVQRVTKLKNDAQREFPRVDSKRLGDPWLGRILRANRTLLNQLADSFKPLQIAHKMLEKFDEELAAISGNSLISDGFEHLKNLLSSVPLDIENSADVLKKLEACYRLHPAVSPDKVYVEFLRNVTLFSNYLDNVIDRFTFEKKFNKFLDSNSLQLLKNNQSFVNETLKRFLETKSVPKFLITVNELRDRIKAIDYKEIFIFQNLSKAIEEKLKSQEFKDKISSELEVHNCLKKLKNNSEAVIRMVPLIQAFMRADLQNVQQIAPLVSKFSHELSTVKTIPEKMREVASPVTLRMNEMSQMLNQTDEIGISQSVVQSVYSLVDLEPLISQVKGHEDISSLETAISQAKAYISRIDVWRAKSLKGYTNPLKNLTAEIPDIDIIPIEKALRAMDPASPFLEKIAALDFILSKHNTILQWAPFKFGVLQEFLEIVLLLKRDAFE